MPFLSRFSESPSASLGGLLSFWVQEEPLSLRTEREGDQEFPWLFRRPSRILFVQKEGLFAKPIECEPGSLGLGKVVGRAPEPLHGARGRSGVPLAFCTPLVREGLFAEPPLGASLGRGVSAYLQEEPPSLCMEREGHYEFP